MSDEEFDEEQGEEEEDLEEFDEEGEGDESVLDDELDLGSTIGDDGDEDEVLPVADDDDVVDLDEELHPDDVEEALDVVLREKTSSSGHEDDEEYELPGDRGETGTKIVPRRPGEFVCTSCFLVLPRHMLADEKTLLCRDCV